MIYLDTGVLVSALFLRDEKQAECQALITREAVTSTHALGETFATLTGQYRLKNDIVSESGLSAAAALRVEPITRADYLSAIRTARERGIMGGIIYDALHAEVARRLAVERIYTFNVSNFKHVAGDLRVLAP
jgi:predicted nucleic acid-binding protein